MEAWGVSFNQAGSYPADDIVAGSILFQDGILFNGIWCFNVSPHDEKDSCEIYGEKGRIAFHFFDQGQIEVATNGESKFFSFDPLQHVQQPMIEKVVEYFLGQGPNPCTGEEGIIVMKLIDDFTR
jgi:predicted dehydrogenase